jgi:ubiquinone/menaquinone biosynthesis C-methylase UbiE
LFSVTQQIPDGREPIYLLLVTQLIGSRQEHLFAPVHSLGKKEPAVSTNTTDAVKGEYLLSGISSARDLFNLRTVNRDAALVVPHLCPGMRLVDFGCGAGSLTCGFARLVAPADVLGFDVSEEAIDRARLLAEQSGLSNVQFSVSNINELDLPSESFDVGHFSGVLMHLKEPERALQLAFRCLKSGGMLAAREAQKEGDWFSGPAAETIALYDSVVIKSHEARGGDPFLGKRLAGLVREVGFVRLETTPCYSAALSNVRATAATMLSLLEQSQFRATALECAISTERLDRLGEDIRCWADSQDSIAAFAECTVIGWKP